MKAVIYLNYGSPEVFHVRDIPKPVPSEQEVLIALKASTATTPDTQMRRGSPYIGRLYTGLRGPKRQVSGYEFAGVVEAVGKEVTRFKPGDRVFGGSTTLGGYAEYTCVSEHDMLLLIPDHLSFSDVVPLGNSAVTALNFLKKAHLKPGMKVLIYGASGAIGTYAVQLADYFGAAVTGVCSAKNIELVKSLGAGRVIDYTAQDFTLNAEKYDVLFDVVGKTRFKDCKHMLTDRGVYLSVALGLSNVLDKIRTSFSGNKRIVFSATGALSIAVRLKLLKEVTEITLKNGLRTIIDRIYPLAQIVEAHQYVETGRKMGHVVITI